MKPLAGLRVADFTVHAAGPFCTHLLAQLGAEVIKIESVLRPDIFRKSHAVYGRVGPASFDQVASGKLSVRINLKDPEGAALARRLVRISDVAAESFRAGVMNRLGLGYDDLRRERKDLVMVSVSSSGQTGPESTFAGYAPLFGAWGGLGWLSGYQDGPPVEMRHVMDHSVGLNAALATLAALQARRRTGEGAHVDVAAREVASATITEAIAVAALGVVPARDGNGDPLRAPHGVYLAAEADRWVTLSVRTDQEWLGLCRVMGRADLAADPRLSTQRCRHAARDRLDAIVSDFTRHQQPEALVAALQAAGVPAHLSWSTADLAADPHLRQRGALVEVAEGDTGRTRLAVGAPMRFSRSDNPSIERGTPALGEHEDYVFGTLLGLSALERQRLEAARIIH